MGMSHYVILFLECAVASSLWDHVSQFVLVLQLALIVKIMLVRDSVQ